MITIVDYKMGNLGSILNMFRKLDIQALITSDKDLIVNAEKLILPGVGSFDSAMHNLQEMNLIESLNKAVLEKGTPTLGICLGMQIMTKKSEEGTLSGLGWFDAEVVRFEASPKDRIKVPHMGWNFAKPVKENSLISITNEDTPRFYFVHSYYVAPKNEKDILARTSHGVSFTSAISRDKIAGVQFHPEKSHRYGMALLHNFATRF